MNNADIKLAIWNLALYGKDSGKSRALRKFADVENEKIYLYERVAKEQATALEIVRLSYLRNIITADQYLDYLQIEKASYE